MGMRESDLREMIEAERLATPKSEFVEAYRQMAWSFFLLAAADAQHKRLHLLWCHPHSFPVRPCLVEHRIQLFLAAVEALTHFLFPHRALL